MTAVGIVIRFSPDVIAKAQRLLDEGLVYASGSGGLGSCVGDSDTYIQTWAEDWSWSTCSCPHGKHRTSAPATCSHVAAQMLAARDGHDLPVKRPALGKGSAVPDDPFDLAVEDGWSPR